VFVTGGGVRVTGGAGVLVVGFVDALGLTDDELSGPVGCVLGDPDADCDGLWLGDPLGPHEGVGDGEVEGVPDGVEVGVPLDESLGVAVGDADAESVADELGEPLGLDPVGVGVGVHGEATGDADASARLGLTGTTSSVPNATVPVAITPITDTADRFLRACFGTVQTPSFRRFLCNSEHAPQPDAPSHRNESS
jgi:hypothetical protein